MGRRSVKGGFHQASLNSDYAGFQCTAISYFALMLLFLQSPPVQHWNTDVVNRVVMEGHNLYVDALRSTGNTAPRYLGHWELPRSLMFDSTMVNANILTDLYHGIVGETGNHNFNSVSIEDGLQQALSISRSVLATFGTSTIAISNDPIAGVWHIFDSHSRDSSGRSSADGTSILFSFTELQDMLLHLHHNYARTAFNFSPITFTSVSALQLNAPDTSNFANAQVSPQCAKQSGTSQTKSRHLKRPNSSRKRKTSNLNAVESEHSYNAMKYQHNARMSDVPQLLEQTVNHSKLQKTAIVVATNMPQKSIHLAEKRKVNRKKKTPNPLIISNSTMMQMDPRHKVVQLNHSYVSVIPNDAKKSNAAAKSINTSVRPSPNPSDKPQFIDLSSLNTCDFHYENEIRRRINGSCNSCERFLLGDTGILGENLASNLKNVFSASEQFKFCSKCAGNLKNDKLPPSAAVNNLHVNVTPPCLNNLSLVEKRLISQIQSFLTILLLPGGQFAERGLAIHFPLDLDRYFSQLGNIFQSNIIVVDQSNNNNFQTLKLTDLADCNKVKSALAWLKKNNRLYETYPDCSELTTVDPAQVTSDIANLRRTLSNIPESSTVKIDSEIPDIPIQAATCSNSITLPIKFQNPIWINDIPHGEELAFPWLFPNGKNGLTEDRDAPLSVKDYFQSRMYNFDSRWRKDITYLMYAVNHMEQKSLMDCASFHLRKRKPGCPNNSILSNRDIESLTDNPDVRKNSYMFMKHIRGTAAYWTDILHDLLAMVKSLGPPTIFLTLSADDNHWPELIMLLKDCSYEEALNIKVCSTEMISDPLLASLHFELRWKAFFKHVLCGSNRPLGKITDHFARVEYQNRGSPHIHCFLWIENSPSFIHSTTVEIEDFIDRLASTQIPTDDPELENLVRRLQVHRHTQSCMRNNLCRFGFPKPICEKTKLFSNVDLTNSNNRAKFYETKRSASEININAYNPTVLRRWRANTDIQVVSSSHSLAYYVCTYISKSEPEDLKNCLANLFSTLLASSNPPSLRSQLLKIGNCVLKTRRLSAQEACARLCSLKLMFSSRTVLFVNTRPDRDRFRMLKPLKDRQNLPPESTDIFASNIIDYYRKRPDSLEDASLFHFATWYIKCSDKSTTLQSKSCQPRIKIKNTDIIMRKKTKGNIIRSPKLGTYTDQYYFSLLMLHLPHRSEESIIPPFTSAKEAFTKKYGQFKLEDIEYDSLLHDLEDTMHSVNQLKSVNEDLSCLIAPGTHELNSVEPSFSSDHEFSIPVNVADTDIHNPHLAADTQTPIDDTIPLSPILPETELQKRIALFNKDQESLFKLITNHYTNNDRSTSLRLFISGGGGTGKSYILQTIVHWLRRYMPHISNHDPVLVCAPTGMSAKNVCGRTLHSTFRLPVQHGKQPKFQELSSRILNELRPRFKAVHTVIIDEVSMISTETLNFINRRLITLTEKNEYFGGVNIILMGDFYQLRPVRGSFVFNNEILWPLYQPYILYINMRQQGDTSYRDLLNRVRIGEPTAQDIDQLKTRLIANDNPQFKGVLRVYPTVKKVEEYNTIIQSTIDTATIAIPALHLFAGGDVHNQTQSPEDFLPIDDRNAGGLSRVLRLSVGTRVMLIRNIATDNGLVNGALGFVHHLEIFENQVTTVYVKFDDSTIGRIFYKDDHDAIAIDRISQEFHAQGHAILRTQFPLMPAWACSIHKVQGLTCDRIVVDLGSDIFAAGQAYVALSRVTTLEGLGLLSLNPKKIRADQSVIAYYKNLSDSE